MPMGTRLSMSSCVRSVTGIARIAERQCARDGRKMPHTNHDDLVNEQPMMIEGAPQQHVVDEANDV